MIIRAQTATGQPSNEWSLDGSNRYGGPSNGTHHLCEAECAESYRSNQKQSEAVRNNHEQSRSNILAEAILAEAILAEAIGSPLTGEAERAHEATHELFAAEQAIRRAVKGRQDTRELQRVPA